LSIASFLPIFDKTESGIGTVEPKYNKKQPLVGLVLTQSLPFLLYQS